MDAILVVGCAAVLVFGGYWIWTRRAPKFKNVTEADWLNITNGVVHPEFAEALAKMLADVSNRMTVLFGSPRNYTRHTVTEFIQVCRVVPSLGGASGDIFRMTPSGPTTLQVVRGAVRSMIVFQHECLHRLVWDDPELTALCAPYASNGYHAPVLFDPYGSH